MEGQPASDVASLVKPGRVPHLYRAFPLAEIVLDNHLLLCYSIPMKPNQSLIQQQVRGTYDRNQKIVKLYQSGIIINMAELGRIYHISRQRVKAIIDRSNGGN